MRLVTLGKGAVLEQRGKGRHLRITETHEWKGRWTATPYPSMINDGITIEPEGPRGDGRTTRYSLLGERRLLGHRRRASRETRRPSSHPSSERKSRFWTNGLSSHSTFLRFTSLGLRRFYDDDGRHRVGVKGDFSVFVGGSRGETGPTEETTVIVVDEPPPWMIHCPYLGPRKRHVKVT